MNGVTRDEPLKRLVIPDRKVPSSRSRYSVPKVRLTIKAQRAKKEAEAPVQEMTAQLAEVVTVSN